MNYNLLQVLFLGNTQFVKTDFVKTLRQNNLWKVRQLLVLFFVQTLLIKMEPILALSINITKLKRDWIHHISKTLFISINHFGKMIFLFAIGKFTFLKTYFRCYITYWKLILTIYIFFVALTFDIQPKKETCLINYFFGCLGFLSLK